MCLLDKTKTHVNKAGDFCFQSSDARCSIGQIMGIFSVQEAITSLVQNVELNATKDTQLPSQDKQ